MRLSGGGRPLSTHAPTARRFAAVAGPLALSTLGIIGSFFAAAAIDGQPRTAGRVAAVFPPWWDAARVVSAAAAAGDIAGAGGAPFIVILRGDPAALNQRARTAGALLLLDPALAGACARPASEPVTS